MGCSSSSHAEEIEKMRLEREARLGLLSRGLYPANMNYPGRDPMYTDPYAPRLPPHMESRDHYASYGYTGDYHDNERHPVFTPPPPGVQRALSAGGRALISSPPKRTLAKTQAKNKPSPSPAASALTSTPTRLRWVPPGEDHKEESSPMDLLAAVRRARRGTTAEAEDYTRFAPPGTGLARRHKNSPSGSGVATRAGGGGGGASRSGSPSRLGASKGKGRLSSPASSYGGGGRLKPSVEQALIMLEAQETEERAYMMNEELYAFGDILSLFQYALELEVIREAAFELFDFEKSSRATVHAQERRERLILSYWMQENYDDVALGERLRDVQLRQGTVSPFRGGSSQSCDRRFMSPGTPAPYDRCNSAEDNFNERYWAIRRSNSNSAAPSYNNRYQDARRLVVSGRSADPKTAYAPTNKYTPTSGAPTAPLVDDSVVLDALQLRDRIAPRVAVAPPLENGHDPLLQGGTGVKRKEARHATRSPRDKKASAVAKKKTTKKGDAPLKETKRKESGPHRSAPLQPDDGGDGNSCDDDYYQSNDGWKVESQMGTRGPAAPASSTIRVSPRDATVRSSYSPVPEDPSSFREASIAALHDRFVALLSTPV